MYVSGRVVVHKTSNFSDPEMSGFMSAASDLRIDTVDFVTVMDSRLRFSEVGRIHPFVALFVLDEQRQLLYTRGSIWYYKTYRHVYSQPLELRIIRSEQARLFAKEILGLTK